MRSPYRPIVLSKRQVFCPLASHPSLVLSTPSGLDPLSLESRPKRTAISILRRLFRLAYWLIGSIPRYFSLQVGAFQHVCRGSMVARSQASQVPGGFRCVASAVSTYLMRVRASKGLVRKHVAPPFIACVRTTPSGKAVTKMNGTVHPLARSRACNSTPPMTGIRTSVITHDVSLSSADCRKSPADANVRTVYPRDLRRLSVANRMDASSSTTAINVSPDLRRLLTQCILAPTDLSMRGLGVSGT
jgi:hypothetical protein